MVEALVKSRVPKMAAQLRNCNTNVVSMPWRNNNNTIDTWVYVMRHMETYFGEREKEWECGLSAKGTKGLEMLRIKFATALLTSPLNSKGGSNQTQATKHWIDRPSKFNFERWVENYGLN